MFNVVLYSFVIKYFYDLYFPLKNLNDCLEEKMLKRNQETIQTVLDMNNRHSDLSGGLVTWIRTTKGDKDRSAHQSVN